MDQKEVSLNRPRPLTFDEKHAAEAAFQGEAPNPAWSASAQRVYEGLVFTLVKQGRIRLFDRPVETTCSHDEFDYHSTEHLFA